MAKKLISTRTNKRTMAIPTKKAPIKKVSATKSAAAKKAAITKKLKKENEIILNDEKVKDLLDAIATITVERDELEKLVALKQSVNEDLHSELLNLRKETQNMYHENSRLESVVSDYETEMNNQRVIFANVSKIAEESSNEIENFKRLYNNLITINKDLRDKLDTKQLELETRNLDFVRLQNSFDQQTAIVLALQTEYKVNENKWYNKFLKWMKSLKS